MTCGKKKEISSEHIEVASKCVSALAIVKIPDLICYFLHHSRYQFTSYIEKFLDLLWCTNNHF